MQKSLRHEPAVKGNSETEGECRQSDGRDEEEPSQGRRIDTEEEIDVICFGLEDR
jgi:hypothetical protein